jgi:hypothetical protein
MLLILLLLSMLLPASAATSQWKTLTGMCIISTLSELNNFQSPHLFFFFFFITMIAKIAMQVIAKITMIIIKFNIDLA